MSSVKLFFKAGDPYCEMVRNLLTFHKVAFEMLEVSRNEEAQQELLDVSGQSNVPVLVVDDRVYVGFDFELLKKVLDLPDNGPSAEKVF
ncbi:MAG: glutaredoxin family protein [Nanoarchaeota archaeon]|nr:glutaredoxin family protein [Nanoarchaeota archaeon]